MTDRRTFIQNAGMTDAQFAGLQLLKMYSYNTSNTAGLNPGDTIGASLGNYAAANVAGPHSDLPITGAPSLASLMAQATTAVGNWTFKHHVKG